MPADVPFKLSLSGSTADRHQFQGYDGYMALAGFAWSLSLVSNYLETGKIRHRGEFPGREAVRGEAPRAGSVVAQFVVQIGHDPVLLSALGLGGTLTTGLVSSALWDLVKWVVGRHVNQRPTIESPHVQNAIETRGGDMEALVAATEPAIRQTHTVIGNGATYIQISGGTNTIGRFSPETKEYVNSSYEDHEAITKSVSVAAFNANSGHGSIYDQDLGRTVAISMSRAELQRLRPVFTWGLDQYANRTNARIDITFWRVLAMDGTPKRYVILHASL